MKRFLPFVAFIAFAVAAFLVWREVGRFGFAGMVGVVAQIPELALAAAIACAAASYGTLTLCDALAVRYAGCRLAYRRIALASFVSLAIGHTLGLAPLGSGALRARCYGGWGLGAEAIGKIILFCAATITIGQTALAGIVLMVEPGPVAAWLHVGPGAIRGLGGTCLALVAAYLATPRWLRRPFAIAHWRFAMPAPRLALGQVGVGLFNFLLLIGLLYSLLRQSAGVTFWQLAAIAVVASVAALVSHVPGGLGVIEFVVLAFLPQASTWGALIVFRIVYYFAPLALGGLMLALGEGRGPARRPCRRSPARARWRSAATTPLSRSVLPSTGCRGGACDRKPSFSSGVMPRSFRPVRITIAAAAAA